jgi:hypothetical protein
MAAHELPQKFEYHTDEAWLQHAKSKGKKVKHKKIQIWVMGLENLEHPESFLKEIPAEVGIVLNPFRMLSDSLISQLRLRQHQLALALPTRLRVDGLQVAHNTFADDPKIIAHFKDLQSRYRIQLFVMPDMIDGDETVLKIVADFLTTVKGSVVLPPQILSFVYGYFKKKNIPVKSVDQFIQSGDLDDVIEAKKEASLFTSNSVGSDAVIFTLIQGPRLHSFTDYIKQIKEEKAQITPFEFETAPQHDTIPTKKPLKKKVK